MSARKNPCHHSLVFHSPWTSGFDTSRSNVQACGMIEGHTPLSIAQKARMFNMSRSYTGWQTLPSFLMILHSFSLRLKSEECLCSRTFIKKVLGNGHWFSHLYISAIRFMNSQPFQQATDVISSYEKYGLLGCNCQSLSLKKMDRIGDSDSQPNSWAINSHWTSLFKNDFWDSWMEIGGDVLL